LIRNLDFFFFTNDGLGLGICGRPNDDHALPLSVKCHSPAPPPSPAPGIPQGGRRQAAGGGGHGVPVHGREERRGGGPPQGPRPGSLFPSNLVAPNPPPFRWSGGGILKTHRFSPPVRNRLVVGGDHVYDTCAVFPYFYCCWVTKESSVFTPHLANIMDFCESENFQKFSEGDSIGTES